MDSDLASLDRFSQRDGDNSVIVDLDGPDETARHQERYRTYLALLQRELKGKIQDELQIKSAFFPGMEGTPVRSGYPGTFFKEDFLFQDALESRSHEIMEGLYRHAMRMDSFNPDRNREDEEVVVYLTNYALWTGRSPWIGTILMCAGISPLLDDLFMVASVLELQEGSSRSSDFHYNLCRKRDPLLSHYRRLLLKKELLPSRNGEISGESSMEGEAPWIRWAEICAGGGTGSEDAWIRRMEGELERNGSRRMAWLFFWALLVRGRVFRAARILMRKSILFGDPETVLAVLLDLYQKNGKYLLLWNRLRLIEQLPAPEFWYDLAYSAWLLQTQFSPGSTLHEMLEGEDPSLPSLEDRKTFRDRLSGKENTFSRGVEGGRGEWLSALEWLSSPDATGGGETLRLWDGMKPVLPDVSRSYLSTHALDRTARVLFWTLLSGENHGLLREQRADLEALAGRNLYVRAILGLFLTEEREEGRALHYLERAVRFHPVVLHSMASLHLRLGNPAAAARLYKSLVGRFGDVPRFWFEYATLQEKMGDKEASHSSMERGHQAEMRLKRMGGGGTANPVI